MRIIDEQGREIKDPDLDAGYLLEELVLVEGVTPIDNVTKYAYEETDWETIQRYYVTPKTEQESESRDLRAKLKELENKIDTLMEAAADMTEEGEDAEGAEETEEGETEDATEGEE